jgi:secreted Zn-dependent insulinase-like peptidase
MKATSNERHPFHKFGTGNLKTLRDDPAVPMPCRTGYCAVWDSVKLCFGWLL